MIPIRTAFAALLLFTPLASAQVGDPFCFGQGCPCNNDDPLAGCGNAGFDGSPSTGAKLEVLGGGAVIVNDDLALGISGMATNQFGMLFTSTNGTSLSFGDGLRCVGGRLYRFPVRQSDAAGTFQEAGLVATSNTFHAGGAVTAGSTWNYQVWYRDPGGPCGTDFNVTNALPVTWTETEVTLDQLVGNPATGYPWFEYVRAINEGAPIHLAFDPLLRPELAGETADVYIVAAKTIAEWDVDPTLFDVRPGGADTLTFGGSDVQSNTYQLDTGTIPGTIGTEIGIGYDVVVDLDQNGVLDPGEPIDGYSDEAGFYVVRDVEAAGPYAVTEIIYTGGTWLGQDLYYPSNIASLGELPLIVVSHGNGHDYRWYDHIGEHMASYGYVVMSHQNNTGPGIHTASTTTLTNTDYLIGNQASIGGGVLVGHLDHHRITWLGHSRGGEGVLRAYTRVFTGVYTPSNFTADDIVLVSSIAPVTFLAAYKCQPEFVNYHLWVGSADSDVTGFGGSYPFALMERAKGNRSSITLQGAGHGAFHNSSGSLWANGPCKLTRPEVHQIMRGQFLPLVKHYIDGDIPSKDFLWRQWESFKPIGAPPDSNVCVQVSLDYSDSSAADKYVIDDYETETAPDVASCGGAVSFTVGNLVEAKMRDGNTSLTWLASDPMNGMTRAQSDDPFRGVVFDWTMPAYYEVEMPTDARNFTDQVYLSLRACQGTRHPNTIAVLEDLTFDVTLRDVDGTSSSISCGFAGGGIEEPYQRTGVGDGAGWANEFETVRLRLTDFLSDDSALDLSRIEAVRLDFGGTGHALVGRLGLDSIELTGN